MLFEIFFTFITACAVIALSILLAPKFGLIDHPHEARKKHITPTPTSGGLAIFLTIIFSLTYYHFDLLDSYFYLLLATGACVVIGVIDDIFHIRALVKMLLQILIVSIFVILSGLKIHYLGDLFGFGAVGTRWVAIPFTIFCMVVLMNAINWIDGMDGLSGGILFIIFAMLLLVAGNSIIAPIILTVMVVIFAFLLFNMRWPWLKKAKIFMGDAGSLGLGFVLAWVVIYLTQIDAVKEIPPMVAVWIISYPCFDMISSVLNRIVDKKPIYSADNLHAHFIIKQKFNLSVAMTSYLLILLATIYGGLGLILYYILKMPEFMLLINWLLVAMLHFLVIRKFAKSF